MREIWLEGIDGAGKTTIVKRLAEDPDLRDKIFTQKYPNDPRIISVIKELKEVNKGIKGEDKTKLQAAISMLFVADQLAGEVREVFPQDYNQRVHILDRSIVSNWVYQEPLLERNLHELIVSISLRFMHRRETEVSAIYLSVDPITGIQRCINRSGNAGKIDSSAVSYLKNISSSYREALSGLQKTMDLYNLFEVDANRSENEVYADVKDLILCIHAEGNLPYLAKKFELNV